jgi:hypothetical protein
MFASQPTVYVTSLWQDDAVREAMEPSFPSPPFFFILSDSRKGD